MEDLVSYLAENVDTFGLAHSQISVANDQRTPLRSRARRCSCRAQTEQGLSPGVSASWGWHRLLPPHCPLLVLSPPVFPGLSSCLCTSSGSLSAQPFSELHSKSGHAALPTSRHPRFRRCVSVQRAELLISKLAYVFNHPYLLTSSPGSPGLCPLRSNLLLCRAAYSWLPRC